MLPFAIRSDPTHPIPIRNTLLIKSYWCLHSSSARESHEPLCYGCRCRDTPIAPLSSFLLFSSPLGVSFSRRRSHSIRGILIDFLPGPITDEMSVVKGTVSRQCLSHDLCSCEHLSRAGIKEFHSISATIDVCLSGLRLRNHIEHFYLMSFELGILILPFHCSHSIKLLNYFCFFISRIIFD